MRQIVKFLREVFVEFNNITWPSRQSLFQLTFVVISISVITSLILGGFDYLFTSLVSLLSQSNQAVITPALELTLPTPEATNSSLPSINPTKIIIPTIKK